MQLDIFSTYQTEEDKAWAELQRARKEHDGTRASFTRWDKAREKYRAARKG